MKPPRDAPVGRQRRVVVPMYLAGDAREGDSDVLRTQRGRLRPMGVGPVAATVRNTTEGRQRSVMRGTRRGALLTRLAGRLPVLMYHGVATVADDPFHLFVTPARFRRQMLLLKRCGLRGVSLATLGDAIEAGPAQGLVGITFDDGYRDVLRFAVPVLHQYGFAATFFVVSDLLGGSNTWDPPPRRDLMTVADVRALAASGQEIGSHGVRHARLTEVTRAELRHEVAGSRKTLADLLGAEPRSFCYPYGAADATVVSAVADAGYTYGCVAARVPGIDGPLATPRIGVGERDTGARFVGKLLLRGR
jgi:peptidoglycan/xylan/chitin deacetylase (PgdA/CDA1 family)